MTTTPSKAEIAHRHAHHAPINDKVGERHGMIRQLFTDLSCRLWALLPPGRELSLALTKLDEGRMWSNAAVALNQTELPPLDAPPEAAIETAWLIESRGKEGDRVPMFVRLHSGCGVELTTANNATRFARQHDAEAVAAYAGMPVDGRTTLVTEHRWG